MAAIDLAGKDMAALAAVTSQMGNVLLRGGTGGRRRHALQEQQAIIDKADVPAQVKEQTHRQAIFDEARVALARNDVATAKTRAAAYSSAVSAKQIPFEVRQGHELAGRIALAEKNYPAAVAELKQANQQDPRVLYLTAVALQGSGDAARAKEDGAQAAEFNGLSATYGYVRGKAKAMITAKRD
jgi:lipopolysaccharide biosynthesis regulator YciM